MSSLQACYTEPPSVSSYEMITLFCSDIGYAKKKKKKSSDLIFFDSGGVNTPVTPTNITWNSTAFVYVSFISFSIMYVTVELTHGAHITLVIDLFSIWPFIKQTFSNDLV